MNMRAKLQLRESPLNMRLLPLAFILLTFLAGSRVHAQVVVIANSSVKSTEVSTADLRDLFTGTTSTFKDGSHVTPVLLKSGTVNDDFLTLYVGKSDAAFRASWRSLLFSGQGVMPRTLDTEAAVVEYVAHTPGAVGYIARSTPHEGVKVLAVR
jgi:ABC-type phosphate transport system substrate-binding protein